MISVACLTKCFGDFTAVNELSFQIEEGQVYGFLGPNGAGKSTTMNIMTGCLSATSGQVLIDGHDILEEPEAAKKLIGYLPEQPPLYLNETPVEYLKFVGEAKGIRGRELARQVESVVGQTRIETVKNQLISTLSKGYRQRVGIAQALLGNPRVIILDEPTVGLDPLQIIEIRDLIKQLGQSHTVILSSHILSEVQAICEQVLILSRGKLVAFDKPENLEKLLQASNRITFQAQATSEDVAAILCDMDGIMGWDCADADNGAVSVTAEIGGDRSPREVGCALFFAFAQKERPIFEMASKKTSLEDVFIELTEGDNAWDSAADGAAAESGAAAPENGPDIQESEGSEQ